MNIKSKLFLVASIAILATGCASGGNERMRDQTQASVSQKIAEGKTGKEEVKEMLGDATSVSFTDSGNEIWTYKHARATPKAQNFIPIVNLFSRGADVKTKELVILFDKNGIVNRYSMRETDDEVKSGLAH
jgi:outer membrane protein assembly factor BamE (lipoprotein component of BamABCDE complex)